MSLLAYCAVDAISYAPSLTDKSCTYIGKITFLLDITVYVPISAFSALRAFALSGLNWKLALLVFILGCGPFAINLWNYNVNAIIGINLPIVGCTATSTQTVSEARMTLLVLNALHLILTLTNEFLTPEQAVSLVELLTDPLSIIIICRFLLALQSANRQLTSEETINLHDGRDGEYGNTLRFASVVVGTLGGEVDPGGESGVDEKGNDMFDSPADESGGDTS
ncbi:hypothetical protein GY45DRAFT_1433711 [Cubamyces sp. BRFM 1775]|nr:hypothetical protein GY45DRAFT_1433711 [Cubamyces sp. BRFM 1775]